jgi:hypothetical protein
VNMKRTDRLNKELTVPLPIGSKRICGRLFLERLGSNVTVFEKKINKSCIWGWRG